MKKGFTLIELLVVVLIIGILAAIAVPQYRKAVLRSRSAQAIIMSKALLDAQKVYYMANGIYTDKIEDLGLGLVHSSVGESHALIPYGSCTLSPLNAKDKRVYCTIGETLSYQRFLEVDKIMCCSYPETNYIADSICKAETGVTTWFNGCEENRVCRCYKTP